MSRFINRISSFHQATEPPQFYGGIIADSMGLGKTLTMIALTATDLDGKCDSDLKLKTEASRSGLSKPHVLATLIVIPPPREFPEKGVNKVNMY